MNLRTAAALVAICAALGLASSASADLAVGVVDDRARGPEPEWVLSRLTDLGLSEVRVTVGWDPAEPTTIREQEDILRMLPFAQARGIRVIVAIDLARPGAVGNSTAAANRFAAFTAQVARTFPGVKDVIVGNEPNQTRFWQPQYNRNRTPAACAAYTRLLAASYDAIKRVDPTINVIGVGLSPRGNDNPRAASNVSRSPVRCLRDMGAAYRGMARRAPLMNELSFHPYPNSNRDGLMKGYLWPNAGVANLDRIKQAVWDAFRGTGQRTFATGLRFRLDEVGWQVRVAESSAHAYEGLENVTTTDERTQAQIYGGLIGHLACDPTIRSVLFFGLIDEPVLERWQAAFLRADGTPRPAYDVVKTTIARTSGRCTGRRRAWRPSQRVVGARAFFPRARSVPAAQRSFSLKVRAQEATLFRAGIFRVAGRKAIAAALGRRGGLLRVSGSAQAYRTPIVRLRGRRLTPGSYVYGVRLAAETNPKRTATFVSPPFRVGRRT